jgi:hypothetical protein
MIPRRDAGCALLAPRRLTEAVGVMSPARFLRCHNPRNGSTTRPIAPLLSSLAGTAVNQHDTVAGISNSGLKGG